MKVCSNHWRDLNFYQAKSLEKSSILSDSVSSLMLLFYGATPMPMQEIMHICQGANSLRA